MKLQVLVTTMYQSDLNIYSKMNLQTDAVIANQGDRNDYLEEVINENIVQLVSTKTRGLSRNRNIALAHASQSADLILFSDDDLVFGNDYEKLIIEEFEKHPYAEAMKFNLHDLSETKKISMKRIKSFERCTRRNMSSSGMCGVVIKTQALKRIGLHFHDNFGTGTENYCGEDTIFLQTLINKKVKFYRSPVDIAGIDQTESTWFEGFDEKYFTVTGKVLATIYPRLAILIALRSAYRFSKNKRCDLKFFKIFKYYRNGIKAIKRKKNDC